jgi:translation initiation factor 1 (eIF-1/SUI1)
MKSLKKALVGGPEWNENTVEIQGDGYWLFKSNIGSTSR